MVQPGTFDRIYAAIRDRLRQGRYRPGERLEPGVLADELYASVTPVRDALHRLTGERLVEAPRHEGFRVPAMTENLLRHLYAWHRDLVLLALAKRPGKWTLPVGGSQGGTAVRPDHIFVELARATGNPEHALALQSVIERVEPVRRFEELLLNGAEEEARQILDAVHSGNAKALRKALLGYHRRRARLVPQLLDLLNAPNAAKDDR